MRKTVKITARILTSLICLMLVLSLGLLSFFALGYGFYEYERWQPDKDGMLSDEELLKIIKTPELTDAEYDILYRQTGLTKIGVDRVLADSYPENIFSYRNSFFGGCVLENEEFALFCNQISTEDPARIVPLREGDIIVSSSTNFSMWDIGHSAMVIDAERDLLIESLNPEEGSHLTDSFDFMTRPDFMVLRPRIDSQTVKKIVSYTRQNLLKIPYDATVGVLSPKNPETLTKTQCAHIIWYAFMKFGIDIDSDGGAVVTPQDIANSEYFELVQVYGFDPDALWR